MRSVCLLTGELVLLGIAALAAVLTIGLLLHRTRAGGHLLAYAMAVLIGLDVTANAVLGGRIYSTISCRTGESMRNGGWAAHVRWPAWWRAHCAAAIHAAIV